jgi:hypothetical protein
MPGMVRRLSKSEKLLNEQMLVLLEWAADHPKRWHDIARARARRLFVSLGFPDQYIGAVSGQDPFYNLHAWKSDAIHQRQTHQVSLAVLR